MPVLVHLSPEKNAASIVRGGIKPRRVGRGRLAGVYCMPVLPDFTITNQWAREIKRAGSTFHRTVVSIHFRLPSDKPVWVGHYGRDHLEMPLGQAIKVIRAQPDARGYELIVPRAIDPAEIRGVKHLPQVTGWRYMPNAHGRPPCTCPICLPRGQFKSVSIRQRLSPESKPRPKAELMAQLRATGNEDAIIRVLWALGSRHRGAPEELAYLMRWPSASVRGVLAQTLRMYRGRTAKHMLRELALDPDEGVREQARRSLGEESAVAVS